MDGCGKSRRYRDSISGPSSPDRVAYVDVSAYETAQVVISYFRQSVSCHDGLHLHAAQ